MPSELLVIGLSHQTAPIGLRERLAVDSRQLASELQEIARAAGLAEAVLISTCNRVEVVAFASDREKAGREVLGRFNARVAPDKVDAYLYRKTGPEAARHLFRVAAGMEAMVFGEPQILGQVKESFTAAQAAGMVGTLLNRCFERAFTTAKRVRTETAIAAGHVSVSSIACELTEKIFGELRGRKVLLIGAGEMSLEAARTLIALGAELRVVNRSPERAKQIADLCGGKPRPLEALAGEMAEADVVISSTSSPDFIVTRELMQGVARERRGRRLFIIDIAVPRDVDPRVGSMENVFLFNIDDLQGVAEANLASRKREMPAAEKIIDAAVDQYQKWLASLQVTPTIVALRERFRGVMLQERDAALSRIASLSDKDRRALEAMCETLINKLLHAPLTELKRGSETNDQAALIDATRRLFQLTDTPPSAGESKQGEDDSSSGEDRS